MLTHNSRCDVVAMLTVLIDFYFREISLKECLFLTYLLRVSEMNAGAKYVYSKLEILTSQNSWELLITRVQGALSTHNKRNLPHYIKDKSRVYKQSRTYMTILNVYDGKLLL